MVSQWITYCENLLNLKQKNKLQVFMSFQVVLCGCPKQITRTQMQSVTWSLNLTALMFQIKKNYIIKCLSAFLPQNLPVCRITSENPSRLSVHYLCMEIFELRCLNLLCSLPVHFQHASLEEITSSRLTAASLKLQP